MTAEIALLNRRALAFAADSAVTISDGTNNKIYNSAEKIFELSRITPIGVMLYNSLEFVGVPLDVLVRKFRSDADEPFGTCKDACSKFLDFLCAFKRYKINEDDHLKSILSDELSEIVREHKFKFPAYYSDRVRANNAVDLDVASSDLFKQILQGHTEVHSSRPLDGFLADKTIADFSAEYSDAITDLVNAKLKRWARQKDIVDLVYEWAFSALKSDIFSDSLIGLVFGGFGTNDLFPSLHSVELDGIYFGVLKCKVTNDVDIDRRGEEAKIIPFAQSEMVERFLFGLDDETQTRITSYIKKSIDKALQAIGKSFNVDTAALGLTAEGYAGDVSRFLDRLKRRSRDETLDMVDFMPKQELAYTAEAFVTLTSIKRKVSAQEETVGGPIDVAIITQNEGFVWIKRKHYFDPELNPGYNVRTFVNTKRSADHDRAEKTIGRKRSQGPSSK